MVSFFYVNRTSTFTNNRTDSKTITSSGSIASYNKCLCLRARDRLLFFLFSPSSVVILVSKFTRPALRLFPDLGRKTQIRRICEGFLCNWVINEFPKNICTYHNHHHIIICLKSFCGELSGQFWKGSCTFVLHKRYIWYIISDIWYRYLWHISIYNCLRSYIMVGCDQRYREARPNVISSDNTLLYQPIIIIIITRPRPAFGRLGLGGSSGGYSSHG